ncbi:MAG: hypothetical protein ABIH63_03890 [archaeon]
MAKTAEIELHAHPYFNKYGLEEIVKAMEENEIDIIALEYLNGEAFMDVKKHARNLRNKGYKAEIDELAVRIEKDDQQFYILRAAELSTREKFHLLTIGYDNINRKQTIREMIEAALNQEALVIFDHPYVNSKFVGKEITWQEEKEMTRICREYTGSIALEWNGYCIPWLRKLLGGRDVNSDVVRLSQVLARDYNVPIVTSTDVHARSKQALKAIGTSRIKSEVDTTSGRAIISSLKQNIFSGKHEKTYKTVPLKHFIPYFAIPYVFEKFFERPRG